jgi:protein gp37
MSAEMDRRSKVGGIVQWPLPNVHVGVSVEDQKAAELRIGALLDTPAAVRWLSCEPLIGPVDLYGLADEHGHRRRLTYWTTGRPGWGPANTHPSGIVTHPLEVGPRLDWVVCGGESGPGARRMDPAWARQLRDQCAASGVPFFFKQTGSVLAKEWGCASGKGGDPAEWPESFPREFPRGH